MKRTRGRDIDLTDVCALLSSSDIDTVAGRLGVKADSIAAAARRGTPRQRALIAAARREAADRKREAALDTVKAAARRTAPLRARDGGRFAPGFTHTTTAA